MKVATFALAGLALFAAIPAKAEQGCLRGLDIYSFDAQNDRTLIVESNRHEKYKLALFGTCTGMKFKQHLAFKTIGGSDLSCLSKGDEVLTRDWGSGIHEVCVISKIEPYTAAMQAADKAAKAAKDAAKENKPAAN
ncbi:MAG TPA: DUF6491 family protein [Rhizomicrobium sp.]|jgi:hypothetical protein|nr:DUF6491 family protein [Rhizomicrobium sp.]